MIDMQFPTLRLLSLGGRLMGRLAFELLLRGALSPVDKPGHLFLDEWLEVRIEEENISWRGCSSLGFPRSCDRRQLWR